MLGLKLLCLLVLASPALCQACQEGLKFPVPDGCSEYSECVNGTLVTKDCGFAKRFDQKSGKCLYWWKATCSEVECLEGDKAPVSEDCYSYKSCQKGKWVRESCRMYHKFHPEQKVCTYHYDCKDTPQCEDGTRKGVSTSCKKYMECRSGKWEEETCGMGKGFDLEALECQWSEECPGCSEGDTAAVQGDCRGYRSCKGGRWTNQSCSFFKRFHPVNLQCELWYKVTCGAKCKEGTKMAIPNQSGSYRLCQGGVWIDQSCHWPYSHFNAKSSSCVYATGLMFEEQCSGSWKKAVPGDCQKYRECSGGRVVTKSCMVMMRFDEKAVECRFGWFVKCDKPDVRQCKEYDRRPVRDACTEYQECQDGTWTDQQCLLGGQFDTVTRVCKKPGEAACDTSSRKPVNCEEGTKRAVAYTCDGYEVCSDGQWSYSGCPAAKKFDSVLLECVELKKAKCSEPECFGDEVKADPGDCQKYSQCQDGKYVGKECSILHKFDVVKGQCVWRWSATCAKDLVSAFLEGDVDKTTKSDKPATTPTTTKPITKPTTTMPTTTPTTTKPTTKPSTTKPTTTPTTTKPNLCPQGTVYPVENSCKDYKTCDPDNGQVTDKSCKWCQNFDPKLTKCVWSWKYRCDEATTKSAETTTTTTTTTTAPTTAPPKCTTPGKLVPVDCKNYKSCEGGVWVNKSCPWGQHFDVNKLECRIAWWAKC